MRPLESKHLQQKATISFKVTVKQQIGQILVFHNKTANSRYFISECQNVDVAFFGI